MGGEPDERPVELEALLDSRGHLVGRRVMPDGSQRCLGRVQRGGEIGGRTRCVRKRRIRQAFERRRDGLLEILNRRRAIREQPSQLMALVREGQEHQKDGLGVADAVLEGLELARVGTRTSIPREGAGLAQTLSRPAARVARSRSIRTHVLQGAEACEGGEATQNVGEALLTKVARRTGQRKCSRMPNTTRPKAMPTAGPGRP